MGLGVLLLHRVQAANRGLPAAQISKTKGEEADECFESSDNDRILCGADGRGILTSR
jgi:hypothetical protein